MPDEKQKKVAKPRPPLNLHALSKHLRGARPIDDISKLKPEEIIRREMMRMGIEAKRKRRMRELKQRLLEGTIPTQEF